MIRSFDLKRYHDEQRAKFERLHGRRPSTNEEQAELYRLAEAQMLLDEYWDESRREGT